MRVFSLIDTTIDSGKLLLTSGVSPTLANQAKGFEKFNPDFGFKYQRTILMMVSIACNETLI